MLGRRTKVMDPVGNETVFVYDDLDQVILETITLDGQSYNRTFEYDVEGNVVRSTDRDGRVRAYQYDALNRVSEEAWYANSTDADADINRLNTISYSYDLANRLDAISDNNSSDDYTFDELDRTLTTTAHHVRGLTDIVLTTTYDRLDNAWELSRYVHLKPVRAKMVQLPEQYRWSSYFSSVDGRKDEQLGDTVRGRERGRDLQIAESCRVASP